MTCRERIIMSIEHREPDRVPVDLGSTPSSGISAIAYANLLKFLDIKSIKTKVYDVVQQLAQPDDIILDKFKIDVIDTGRTFNTKDSDWYSIKLSDGNQALYPKWFHPEKQSDGSFKAYNKNGEYVAKMPANAAFYDQSIFPYIDGYPQNFKDLNSQMDKVLWSALVHSPWDNAGEPDFWNTLRNNCLNLRKTTDRALMIVVGCNLFEWGTFLRRLDNFLLDLMMDQENVEKLLDALMEKHLATLEMVCRSVGDIVDILRFGDDLGVDQGPFMDPEIYRKLFKPRHAMLCDYVKKHSNMKTFLHTCGSVYKLIPDLIDAGYDIINPVQTNTKDMEPDKLKREFGKDITFWGAGIDTRTVLNKGTVKEVKYQVKKRIEILSPGGGFVFNTVHNILPEVPPENIIAMFDAIDEFYK
jgi:uroporphyrinogen decarboxylase